MPAIDVLMPMRDAAAWVADAWRSLARQTFRDWRLVAVDDGSRDATIEALAAAAGGDPRLELVPATAGGVAAALNRALSEVAAPVAVRMDADDVAHPRRLERLWTALRREQGLGVIGSRVRLFPGRRVSPTMASYLEWQNGLLEPGELRDQRFVECTLTHATAAFRTEVLTDAGGWWEGDGPEDLDLFLRLHRWGVRFGKLPEVLYFWREHGARETRRSPRLGRAAFRRTQARHLAAELGPGAPVRLFGRGESLRAWTAALARHELEVAAEPWRPGMPPPRWPGRALFCFGHPRVRAQARKALAGSREGVDYLFVG